MKKLIVVLLVFLGLSLTNCTKNDSSLEGTSVKSFNQNSNLVNSITKGGRESITKEKYNEYSRDAFAKLHVNLVKAYYKNHGAGDRRKAALPDTIGNGIPPAALVEELTPEISQTYVNAMLTPSLNYLTTQTTVDSLDYLTDYQVIMLGTYAASVTELAEQGYQVEGYNQPPSYIPPMDSTALSYRIGVCLNQALGVGLVLSIKDIDIAKMTIPQALKYIRTTFVKTVGSYITGIGMVYEFGVCMGWLYDVFGHIG